MRHKFITRRPELRIHTSLSELRTVDHIRIVFDPDSHGKCLLGHIEPFIIDHLVRIAGRMPDSEDERIGFDFLSSINDNTL